MGGVSVRITVERDSANTYPPPLILENKTEDGELVELKLQDPERTLVIARRDLARALRALET